MSLKKWLKKLPIPLSKNHAYDLQASKVLKQILQRNSDCIDVGCHEGEFLDTFLKYAPSGRHIGFEPLPDFFRQLKKNYPNCTFYNIALSNDKGETEFNHVISNPAYSGIKKRQYDKATEQDTTIKVSKDRLDNLIPDNRKIDCIKIDVEGAEYQVMQGAIETIRKNKPIIIFEHGLGAADVYNTQPDMIFDLLTSCGMQINLMSRWLSNQPAFSKEAFCKQFYQQLNYYFMAY